METSSLDFQQGLNPQQASLKRVIDLCGAFLLLSMTFWLIGLAALLATFSTGSCGIFAQKRVGRRGKTFKVYKIKTMRPRADITTTVTKADDPRITRLGSFFRRTKLDELPQLWNVLTGDMSFVGPRPDVPGFADRLQGEALLILSVRPGITGPATLKYRDEEEILAAQPDPEAYNREVIFPDKVRINLEYIRNWRLRDDVKYIWWTLCGSTRR
ncbi:MAG: sugar transferase [Oceanospirillaceae bacterium]|nr:sugar transferase [Oceanospirillaceae bacterium]